MFVQTHFIYEKLLEEWKKNKWDIEELKWICLNIDNNNTMSDPYNFVNGEWAYLNHLNNCFYLKNV